MQSRRCTLEETADRVAIASTKARPDVAQRPTKRRYSFVRVSVDVVGRRHTGVQPLVVGQSLDRPPFGEIIGDPLFFLAISQISCKIYLHAKRRENRMFDLA